jgi:hypothetical protein
MRFYVSGKTIYEIVDSKIPIGSFFDGVRTTRIPVEVDADTGGIVLHDVDEYAFSMLCDIINDSSGFIERFCKCVWRITVHQLHAVEAVADMYGVDLYDCVNEWEYIVAMIWEEHMRDNMYADGFADDAMNTDPYYRLHKIDIFNEFGVCDDLEERFADLFGENIGDDTRPGIIFPQARAQLQNIDTIVESLRKMNAYMQVPGVMLAGGYIYSILYGTRSDDFDLFLTELYTRPGLFGVAKTHTDDNTLVHRIFEIGKIYRNQTGNSDKYRRDPNHARNINVIHSMEDLDRFILYSRTANAITMHARYTYDCQIILRVYKTYSEVLHGFDVDSCCIGYDGRSLLFTERAMSAIRSGYNRVHFGRLSPSYEYRLAKYAKRGMSIWVPGFVRDRICEDLDKFIYYLRCTHAAWQNSAGIGDEVVTVAHRKRWVHTRANGGDGDSECSKSEKIQRLRSDRAELETYMVRIFEHVSEAPSARELRVLYNAVDRAVVTCINEMSTEKHKDRRGMVVANEDLHNAAPMEVFEKWKRVHEKFGDFDKTFYNTLDGKLFSIYRKLHKNVFGLNRIIAMERLFEARNKSNGRAAHVFTTLLQEHSDYNPFVSYSRMRGQPFNGGTRLDALCVYLLSDASREKYPQQYAEYEGTINELIGELMIPMNAFTDLTRCHISMNNVLCHPRKEILTWNSLILQDILVPIDERIVGVMDVLGATWVVPTRIQFKRIAPGEQTTSTFHRTVLEDPMTWYRGPFYAT